MISRILAPLGPPFNGNGLIAGTDPGLVTVGGAPASRRVLILDNATCRPVDEQFSAPDGTYSFAGLNAEREFVVLSFDHLNVYNAVIRDGITPEIP